jgi:hypothetical protein
MKLVDVLSSSHDWAIKRIDKLDKENRKGDAYAIELEFYEWLDVNINSHDVVSMEYIADN